jgi:hypothetical protein
VQLSTARQHSAKTITAGTIILEMHRHENGETNEMENILIMMVLAKYAWQLHVPINK